MEKLINEIKKLLPQDKDILIVCVGSDRITGDCLGPLAGTFLENKGFDVLGTIHSPVHAGNIKKAIQFIKALHYNKFKIAIDACLGCKENIGKIYVTAGPLIPGIGVKKYNLPQIGDMSITGIVNEYVKGKEYPKLIDTRLSLVWDMAEVIANAIEKAYYETCAIETTV